MSRDIRVAGLEGVAEAVGLEGLDDLVDPVRYPVPGLEAEHGADLLERHLVVAGVLVAMDEMHVAVAETLLDEPDEIELAVVLVRVPGVEDLTGHPLRRRLEHRPHRARGIPNVHVRPPE